MGLLPHLFPLFPREVMSNPIKTPKPAKNETRVSEAWNFFSRPAPAGESPRAGGLGEAARTPRVRRPGQALPTSRRHPGPASGPLVPWSLHVGSRGLAPFHPFTAAARSRSVRRGVRVPVPGAGVAPAGKASLAPGGNDASGSCRRRRPLRCLRLRRPWWSLGGLPLPLPGGRGRGGGLRASPARP